MTKGETALETAIQSHRTGNLAEALAGYKAAVAEAPNQPEGWFLKALAGLDAGMVEAALGDLERAIALAPQELDFRLVRSEILFGIGGQDEAAWADLKAAEAFSASDPRLLLALGGAAGRMEDWQKAEEYLFKAILLDPENPAARQALAETMLAHALALAAAPHAGEVAWRETEKDFLKFLPHLGENTRAAAAYGELLLAWAAPLKEDRPRDALDRIKRVQETSLPPELAERCHAFAEQCLAEIRQSKQEDYRRRFKDVRWEGAEPREAVEARLVESVRLRRRGLVQPTEAELEQGRTNGRQDPWFRGEGVRLAFGFHPYLGYVQRPVVDQDSFTNRHGFCMPRPFREYPYNGKRGDDYVVAIFGGSVAHQFFAAEHARLEALFMKHVPEKDRRVTVLNFAQGGYGQPQALLTYTYFRSIGQRFDAVINLDGFNEAMGKRTNQINGYHVSLPLSWVMNGLSLQFQSPTDDPESLAFMARLLSIQGRIARLNTTNPGPVGRWRLRRAERELDRLRRHTPVVPADRCKDPFILSRTDPVDERVFATCPAAATALAEEVAELWARSSLQLGQACTATGTPYLHALQPNQYFWKKPLSAEEEDKTYVEGCPEYWAVRQTYPIMLARAAELAKSGIAFVDLTPCFDTIDGTLAVDSCHFNQRGYGIMFETLAPKLAGMAAGLPALQRPVWPEDDDQ